MSPSYLVWYSLAVPMQLQPVQYANASRHLERSHFVTLMFADGFSGEVIRINSQYVKHNWQNKNK